MNNNSNKLENYIRSPIFYMGNKLDLLHELLPRFPKENEIGKFIDLFGGSGTVSLNVSYKNIIYNELNENIVNLLKIFKNSNEDEIIEHIIKRINEYKLPKLSCDIRTKHYDEIIKTEAKNNYLKFRKYYNLSINKNILDLYTLTFFSFCNLIRFNQKNEFNMPFGNRCFLDEHKFMIKLACNVLKQKNIKFKNCDAIEYLKSIKNNKDNLFIYLDPPYSNTLAIYNEDRAFGGWSIENDIELFKELDRLNKLGVKWALSNVLLNKGKKNNHLKDWTKNNGYEIIYLENKNYASLGKGNAKSLEVLIVNYDTPLKTPMLFDFDEV